MSESYSEDVPDASDNADPAAPDSAPDSASADLGQSELQVAFDEAHAKGYFGESADPTPNEHYTLHGVIAGLPTPETNYDAAVEALQVRVAGAEGVQPDAK